MDDRVEEGPTTDPPSSEASLKQMQEELATVRNTLLVLTIHTERTANIAEETARAVSDSIAKYSQFDIAIQSLSSGITAIKRETVKIDKAVAVVELIGGHVKLMQEDVSTALKVALEAQARANEAQASAERAAREATKAADIAVTGRSAALAAKKVAVEAQEEVGRVGNIIEELQERASETDKTQQVALAEAEKRRSKHEEEIEAELRQARELERKMLLDAQEKERREKEQEQKIVLSKLEQQREDRRNAWAVAGKAAAGLFSVAFLTAVVALIAKC